MKPATKSFIKKLIIFDVAILVLMIVISIAFIIPDCTDDCEIRGEMMGAGTAQLIIVTNFIAAIWHWLRSRRKDQEQKPKS